MNIKELSEKQKNDKKSAFIILAGILGFFLLVLSNFFTSDSINTTEDNVNSNTTAVMTIEQIESNLEERLCETISQISGVGKVSVMVSISSAGEYIYAKNNKSQNDSDSSSMENEIVIYDSGDGDSGLVVSIKSPDVLGVVVVCEGGGSAVIKAEITQLVTSLFGIGSDRVYVGAKASK